MAEPLNLVKYGVVIQVSRAELLDAGLVEPTEAERAEREAWRVECERRRRVEKEAVAALAIALAAVTDPLARAVLDLHKADGRFCAAEQDEYGDGTDWPCRTVETVATTLGIPFPPHLAY